MINNQPVVQVQHPPPGSKDELADALELLEVDLLKIVRWLVVLGVLAGVIPDHGNAM